MENKKIIFYLNAASASFGLTVSLRIVWCLLKTFQHIDNPMTSAFWNYYISMFRITTMASFFLWMAIFITLLIALNIRIDKKAG